MSTITELAGKAAPFSARIAHADAGEACLLMFSGGRDSTLAALRLHHGRVPLRLVTVTSSHLTGINLVRRRLSELSKIPPATKPCSTLDSQLISRRIPPSVTRTGKTRRHHWGWVADNVLPDR